jgi:2-C-methyl-D-erythritol 4-phosphate cytidylyltransferase
MASAIPKQYLSLRGRMVLDHALATLLAHPPIRGAVVAVNAGDVGWQASSFAADARVSWVEGGAERCQSVLNALDALAGKAAKADWVLVHDAARPCLHPADLDRLFAIVPSHPVGGLLAVPVRDTMKRADASGDVVATVDRNGLWHAYTPQMFRYGLLRDALRRALDDDVPVTDEAAAVERLGLAPRLVEGRPDNIKVTRPEDLPLADFFLGQHAEV